MKFRKKPVVIDAMPVKDVLLCARNSWRNLPKWLADCYEKGDIIFYDNRVSIQTLEGIMVGGLEDWIIKGIKGELYPCKPDIFEASYEPEL